MTDETQAQSAGEVDFEEISSDEVDRVVEVLDQLVEQVTSENIKHLLEDASSEIFALVYDEDDVIAVDASEYDNIESSDVEDEGNDSAAMQDAA